MGRTASRPEYWWWYLFSILAYVTSVVVDQTLVLYTLVFLALILPSLAVAFRRLHDTGRSAWWLLITFIPLVGLIVLLVFLVTGGDAAANRYGPPPGADPELVGPSTAPAPGSGSDPAEQIRKLSELKDSGAITAAEFEAKKAELLGRI